MLPLAAATAHSPAEPETGSSATNSIKLAQDYGRLPMSFQPNRGQFGAEATFASRGLGYSLSIHSTGLTLNLRDGARSTPATLEMKLLGADPNARVRGTSPLPGQANYFSGNKENWTTHVPTYGRVQVENAYPGIDAIYYGNQNRLEYDFVIAPGASPNIIDLAFPDSTLTLGDNGDLLISSVDTEFRQAKPNVYQDIDSHKISVTGKYILRDKHRVRFEVGQYDHRKPLVIDPQVIYVIFGQAGGLPDAVAVDSLGNVYLAGSAPDSMEPDITTDAYVAKIDSTGTAFLWSDTFGASFVGDVANAITVDASGNALPAIPPEIFTALLSQR
jgi:hypothetical protein